MGVKATKAILTWFPDSESSLMTIPEFKRDFPELYWDAEKRKKVVSAAFMDATKEWMQYSVTQMIELRERNPLALMRNYNKPYYSPSFSAQLIARLILSQLNDNQELTREFISNFIAVIDKRLPKKNTFVIMGAPSSGKTFFFHSMMVLCWNFGQIRNNKKGGDSFTYMDAIDCRVAEWNECTLMGAEEIETAKMVWEGMPAPVNVKYKTNQRLQRTPLLVSSNSLPWKMCRPEEKAFRDRSFVYTWRRAEWLKHFRLYPNPLLWGELTRCYMEDDYLDNVMTIDQLVGAVTGTVNPDIFFDAWVQKNLPLEEYEQIVADCILYK